MEAELKRVRTLLIAEVYEMPSTLRATGLTSMTPGRLSCDLKKQTLEILKPTKNKRYPTRVCIV